MIRADRVWVSRAPPGAAQPARFRTYHLGQNRQTAGRVRVTRDVDRALSSKVLRSSRRAPAPSARLMHRIIVGLGILLLGSVRAVPAAFRDPK